MGQAGEATTNDKCQAILGELYEPSQSSADFGIVSQLLADLRVLTREKTIHPSVLDRNCLLKLVDFATAGHIEAQKCLSNLILNYAHLRENLIKPYVSCVQQRLRRILDNQTSPEQQGDHSKQSQQHNFEILYYDLRIIFLLSALCPGARASIRDQLLHPLLRVTLIEAEHLSKQNHLLVIESLKTLFNLTMDKCVDTELAAKVIRKLSSAVETEECKIIELDEGVAIDQTDKLLVNLIHLLTNMPREVYLELSDEDVDKVLKHLDDKLKTYSKASFRDTVLPVLNTCANICRYKESVRKRWFDEIIGSTKEFDKRPEEYDTLRGRLVKLMTSVDVHIKEIAAEFLYALCGSDTEKFITYTGFGNAAAYLSTKGLLSPNGDAEPSNATSDKDYKEIRGMLDPITGKINQPKKNPMEGMSEEEKEWHAHELAGAIAKISNLGLIKPMQVGPDGGISEICPKSDNPKSNNSEGSNDSENSKS